ncbi:SdpI family protein [Lacinutrix sp. C3R15]|uniref:SdpI family protein n=1 Tax=Flavobacteriaceae TaxID=49546 RepID=UPI001C0895CD|nr:MULTISPECIES: SdpI family protein [Flavobacteriaceae]MBU2938461.1 SdpI family protein [Lacinutrix sp. C3R15]MDO6621775.1 SdpI family protein [Oceanihabitans sp. 1_MG-2023]
MIPINYILEMPALVGILFIIIGIIMFIFPPKKINMFYGYRTNRSMKHQKNWDFAQKYSSKLLALIGVALTVFSTLNIFFKLKDQTEMIVSTTLIIGSIIFLIVKTENKLKKL